jgi:thymidylate kinase
MTAVVPDPAAPTTTSGGEEPPAVPARFGEAMSSLAQAGVPVRLRKPCPPVDNGSCELDLWIDRADRRRVDETLEQAGFHRVRASGHAPHRFYVTFWDESWFKVDAKVIGARSTPPRLRRLVRRVPAHPRRAGSVIAFLGPDGAGKSTLIADLKRSIPLGVHVAYLGQRRRAGREGTPSGRGVRASVRRHAQSPLIESAFVARALLRHGFRLARLHARAWSGTIVLCDRHPIEALAIEPRASELARRFERFGIERLLPWPDAVVVLDARAELLFARKPEHPPERLRRWRCRYRDEFVPRGAHLVATEGPPDATRADLSRRVFQVLAARTQPGTFAPRLRRRRP